MTREKILEDFPLREEVFDVVIKGRNEGKVTSQVYRDLAGNIVFVVPGSTKWLEKGEQQKNKGRIGVRIGDGPQEY